MKNKKIKIAGLLFLFIIFSLFIGKKYHLKSYFSTYLSLNKIVITGAKNPIFLNRHSLNMYNFIENSIIEKDGKVYFIFDENVNSNATMAEYDIEKFELSSDRLLIRPDDSRFLYYYKMGNNYIELTTRDNNIYCSKSNDLINFTEKEKICTPKSADKDYMWNAAVAGDGNKYVMVVESGTAKSQEDVMLSTFINSKLEFTNSYNRELDIVGGGNPWITYVKNKGYLAVHGMLKDGFWYITASVLPIDAKKWITADKEVFSMECKGVHICDPDMFQINDSQSIMSFSFNQNCTLVYKFDMSFEELFDKILE